MRHPFAVLVPATLVLSLISAAGCQAPPRRANVLEAFAMTDVRLPQARQWGIDYKPPGEFKRDEKGNLPLALALRQLYEDYTKADGDERIRRQVRDEISFRFLTIIKHYHEGTTDDVFELTAQISTGFDIFTATMGGLAAVTGGAADKAGYGALAAFGISARSSLSKNVLAEQTTSAVLAVMDTQRLQKEADIRESLKSSGDNAYPLSAVLADLYDYYTAGSLKDAVATLANTAQEERDRARARRDAALSAAGFDVPAVAREIDSLTRRASAIHVESSGDRKQQAASLRDELQQVEIALFQNERERLTAVAALPALQAAAEKAEADWAASPPRRLPGPLNVREATPTPEQAAEIARLEKILDAARAEVALRQSRALSSTRAIDAATARVALIKAQIESLERQSR